MAFLNLLMIVKTKFLNLETNRAVDWKGQKSWNFEGFDIFRERRCHVSLSSRTIGPSEFFGPRRKAVLRGEGNAWAPVSWSFDKLREVGVLSYLFYS